MATILTANNASVEGTLKRSSCWQTALKRSVRSGRELCRLLDLSSDVACPTAEADFPVFAPHEFISRMKPGDPRDPLLMQVLASHQELDSSGRLDPVGEHGCERSPGCLQKYPRRVLLITTGACAIHCRYCFRRHYPYQSAPRGEIGWSTWLTNIRNDPSIDEVILSGGDPLSVVDQRLKWLVAELENIPHVQRLRLHTRFPIVIPQRVCPELLDWMSQTRLAVYVVLHANHAQEVDASVLEAFAGLKSAGAMLLNQAVLLRGINDSVDAQLELCLRLANQQVMPYYLHQLDPVQGGMHFEVSDQRAAEIVAGLRQQLPGYAVPQLVRELPGELSKTPL